MVEETTTSVASVNAVHTHYNPNDYICPLKGCEYTGEGWKPYRDHIRQVHNREIKRLLWSFWFELFQMVFEDE